MPHNTKLKVATIIGIVLLISGLSLFGYSLTVIKQHEQTLPTTETSLADLWNFESSMDWWRNAYLTLFLPLTAVFMSISGLVLVSQPLLALLHRKKVERSFTENAEFISQQTLEKQEMERETLQ